MSARTGGRRLRVAAVATLLAACSGTGTPPASLLGPGVLTIDSPAPGAVTTVSPVEVKGRAPAGSRVVRDISFAVDQDAIAGTDGMWGMLVELDEGANELRFRIGDDKSTELRLGLTYKPETAADNAPEVSASRTAIPTPEDRPTPSPVAEPTPTPAAEPTFKVFGDGTQIVGEDVSSGTYRLREPAFFCYWARLSGFGGTLGEILANENVVDGYAVVSIGKTDVGFESSGCGEWTSDLSRVTPDRQSIAANGTYIVTTDLQPGTWKSEGGDSCYWARLSGFAGTLKNITANDNVFGGRAVVTIRSTDKGFLTSGCGAWSRS